MMMQRVNLLLADSDFSNYINKNRESEVCRLYCRHDLNHALDVARIAYIMSMEEKLHVDKEVIYAAGLLHDIGRWMEYDNGIDHAEASKSLSRNLLKKYGFSCLEIKEITDAIGHHRNSDTPLLSRLLYQADKLSRNCTSCEAINTCKRFQNGEAPYFNY